MDFDLLDNTGEILTGELHECFHELAALVLDGYPVSNLSIRQAKSGFVMEDLNISVDYGLTISWIASDIHHTLETKSVAIHIQNVIGTYTPISVNDITNTKSLGNEVFNLVKIGGPLTHYFIDKTSVYMTSETQILAILNSIHSFCASMTKREFLTSIGHKSTWEKITRNSPDPNIYDLLSYGDKETIQNLANWLKNN